MYEHKSQRLLPPRKFVHRILRSFAATMTLMGGSLLLGVMGYHYFNALPWLDALLNASMILGGMGPVNPVPTTAGKLFASFYALYSGLVILAAVGVMLAPLFHRLMHTFHVATEEGDEDDRKISRKREGKGK